MAMSQETQKRQMKLASIVIAVAMLGWIVMSWVGGKLGLPVRFAFLVDLAAMAAFLWALIVLFKVWRQRQDMGE